MTGGYFLNAGVLFSVAVAAYERLLDLPAKVGGRGDSLTSILFSAAALEAFIHEFPLQGAGFQAEYDPLRTLHAVIDELEESRVPVRVKFIIARQVLGGTPFDRGKEPYQSFDTLFRVRDSIIHLKPEKITDTPNVLIERLRAADLCEPSEHGVAASWVGRISTPAVAGWACNVAVEMADSLLGCLPPKLHEILSFGRFRRRFSLVGQKPESA